MNMHGEAIALLDPVDGNRAALRIEEGKFKLRGRAVLLAGDDAAESVFGLDHNDIAGVDRQNRFCVGTVDVVERTLLLDREFMALSSPALGQAARCHDRGLEPGIVGHRDILENSGEANRTPAPDFCLVCPSSTSSLHRLRSPEPAVSALSPRSDARPASGRPA